MLSLKAAPRALALFQLNVRNYPTSFKAWGLLPGFEAERISGNLAEADKTPSQEIAACSGPAGLSSGKV
jgi:hypothetical protein